MKIRTLAFILLFAAGLAINSCTIDPVSTDFSVTLTQDFVVNEVNDYVYVKDTLVNAADQSGDIEKYKDQIEKVTLEKATYQLTSFTGDATHVLKHGLISLSDASGANAQTITSLLNVNLQSLLNNETQLNVNTNSSDQLSLLVKNAPHSFKLHAEGTVNKTTFSFVVRLKFYLKIKAKVL